MPKFLVRVSDDSQESGWNEELVEAELVQINGPTTLTFTTPPRIQGGHVVLNAFFSNVISCKEISNGPSLLQN